VSFKRTRLIIIKIKDMLNKIIKFIKEDILRIRPIFKIKIVQSDFSKEFFNIEFSKNNGWTCDYIIRAGINDIDCYYPEIDNIYYTNIESFASKFKSYDDCINYNKSIYNLIKQKNNIKDAGYTKAIDFIDNFNKSNQ
jgi:hypothetical protein